MIPGNNYFIACVCFQWSLEADYVELLVRNRTAVLQLRPERSSEGTTEVHTTATGRRRRVVSKLKINFVTCSFVT